MISCDYITDLKQPEVRIISPDNGDTLLSLGNLKFNIELEGSDDKNLDYIDLFIDDNKIQSFAAQPYNYEMSDTLLSSHPINIKAKAYDKGGNWHEDAIIVYVNYYAPQLEEIGAYDTPGQCYDLTVSGNYTFLADGTEGLRIIDISNPYQPISIGYLNTPDEAHDVAVQGNYAYVADGNSGLRIINITNPANPTETGYYDPPGYNDSYGVYVEGTYAYLTNDSRGLCIIDVSNPTTPVEISHVETYLYKLIKVNDYIYAFKAPGSIVAINISNPSAPYKSAELDIGGPSAIQFRDLAYSSSYLFTAADGFLIIEPTSMQIKSSCSSYGDFDIAINDTIAYVTGSRYGEGTLSNIDISDSVDPHEIYWWNTPANEAYGIKCFGEYLLVASGNSGLRILRVKLCP